MGWRDRAACAGLSAKEADRLFFGDARAKRDRLEARVMCLRCPVKYECLEDADQHEQGHHGGVNRAAGIRAAMTVSERHKRRTALAKRDSA